MNEQAAEPGEWRTLGFDTAIYRLAAIKKAAYKFADRCFVEITSEDDCHVRVRFKPKRLVDRPDHLQGEFQNEVLDQELREVVADETRGIRDLLMAQAFTAAALIDAATDADPSADPLGITQTPHADIVPRHNP